jgi:hypothetical protein
MNRRKYFLGIALGMLALGAVASQAVASTPEVDPLSGKFPVAGTGTSGKSVLSTASGTRIECTSGKGSGQATSKTTGEGSYTLSGCTTIILGFPVSCTSAGQPSGTIATGLSVSHLVYLDAAHKKPGVLATPPTGGVFAKFTCAMVTVEVKGNGVLGETTAPLCGQTSKTGTLVAQTSAAGTQKYRQVEETGTQYDMTVSMNGGAFETAGTDWTVNGTAAEEGTLTCP